MSLARTSIQLKLASRSTAIIEYYVRQREREMLKRAKRYEKLAAEREERVDRLKQISLDLQRMIDDAELQRNPDERLIDEPPKQEPTEKTAYSFMARKSLFPDLRHCDFLLSSAAQIFHLQKTTTDQYAAKASARSALSTAMAMVATVPPNRPNQFTRANTLGRPPMYGKISSIGLYIKYNPGSNIATLPTTAGNPTATEHDKNNNQLLTGHITMVRKIDRQELIFWKGQYSTSSFLTGTDYSAALLGETDRQEFYHGFRKPPPYRDKPSGTEFNSTVHTKGLGASLRREHYHAFRRPPPVRDKFSRRGGLIIAV